MHRVHILFQARQHKRAHEDEVSTASKREKESHANELSRALGKRGVHHDAGEGCSSKRQKAVLQLPTPSSSSQAGGMEIRNAARASDAAFN